MNFDRMRALLLEQAVQGKLVSQLEDEPAVEQIGEVPKIEPFAIPKKWKWVRLNAVGKVIGGGTPKTGVSAYWNGDIPWITPADLGKNHDQIICSGAKLITQKGLDESAARLMPKGSIVYSSRAPIGHIAIAGNDLCTNQGCKSFVPESKCISTEWAYYMLIARTSDIQSRASGTTFKEISGKGMGETWISLPPLPEQIRIVTKIEKSFTEINRAEKAYRELQTLTAVLRKKILQEAVMGKLVPQLDGEPAVEQIGDAPEDVPFAIPEKWKWVQFKSTCSSLDGKRVPVKKSDRKKQARNFPYYGATGIIDYVENYIFDGTYLLIGEDGANLLSKAKDNAFMVSGKFWLNNHAHIFESNEVAELSYLRLVINSMSLNPYVTGSAQPKLTQKKLLSIPVPLPPLTEQRRIVAKVEELMAQVDRLAH